jgi:secreted trypsin-like serine protease
VAAVVALLTLVAAPAGATDDPGVPSPRIVGGTEADNGEYPFQVALLRAGVSGSFAAQFCGGTLIAPRVVLTAAHCTVAPQAAGGIDVLVGGHDLTTTQGTRIDVTSVVTHPRFDGMLYDNDVAILRLASPAPAAPVRLAGIGDDPAWSPGTPATTVGWGLTSRPGSPSPVLREVGVPIVSDGACAAIYGAELVPGSMVCAGPMAGGQDSCNGDSGGPLLVPDPDGPGSWLQVGITSWGPEGCALPDLPGVYAEVAAARPWLDQFLPPDSRLVTMTPERLLDSRRDAGGVPLFDGVTRTLDVTGVKGLPLDDITAVVLNVTMTGATRPSHLTVWPTGEPKPPSSNLNVVPGQTVANLVVARVGANGTLSLVNRSGWAHVVVDAVGWFTDGRTDEGARFTGVMPSRLFDTRHGTGGVPDAPLGPVSTLDVDVAGHAGVPATGASAVVLSLTATGATAPTNLTAWAAGEPRPPTSNLNLGPGSAVPNLVVAQLDASGRMSVFNRSGEVEVVGDVVGWFGEPDASTGTSDFAGLTPQRTLDTRRGLGATEGPVGPGLHIDVAVTGVGGVPAGADAVVLNVTAVGATEPSHLTVHPTGVAPPLASNLNFAAGQTAANLVIVPVGTGGRVSIRNQRGSTHVVADVVGFFAS